MFTLPSITSALLQPHKHERSMSALCMQSKLEHSHKKSLPGASNFEIKSMSSHSALVPGTREGTPKCRPEREKERRPGAAIFTAGEIFFLSSPLDQKTSSRKGGGIRGAAEQGERKRVGSLILMGFLEPPPSRWSRAQRALRINRGCARDSLLC